jgi:hypothetical protein
MILHLQSSDRWRGSPEGSEFFGNKEEPLDIFDFQYGRWMFERLPRSEDIPFKGSGLRKRRRLRIERRQIHKKDQWTSLRGTQL